MIAKKRLSRELSGMAGRKGLFFTDLMVSVLYLATGSEIAMGQDTKLKREGPAKTQTSPGGGAPCLATGLPFGF